MVMVIDGIFHAQNGHPGNTSAKVVDFTLYLCLVDCFQFTWLPYKYNYKSNKITV